MRTVPVRELANGVSALLDALEDGAEPMLITRRGRPIAVLSGINKSALTEFLAAQAPSYAAHRSTTT